MGHSLPYRALTTLQTPQDFPTSYISKAELSRPRIQVRKHHRVSGPALRGTRSVGSALECEITFGDPAGRARLSVGGSQGGVPENHGFRGYVVDSCPVPGGFLLGPASDSFRGRNEARVEGIRSVWWGRKNYWRAHVRGPAPFWAGNPRERAVSGFPPIPDFRGSVTLRNAARAHFWNPDRNRKFSKYLGRARARKESFKGNRLRQSSPQLCLS